MGKGIQVFVTDNSEYHVNAEKVCVAVCNRRTKKFVSHKAIGLKLEHPYKEVPEVGDKLFFPLMDDLDSMVVTSVLVRIDVPSQEDLAKYAA